MRSLPAAPRVDGHEEVYLKGMAWSDYTAWSTLRAQSQDFLQPFEPVWEEDHLTKHAFRNRLQWYATEMKLGTLFSFGIFRYDDDALLGGCTLSDIKRGCAQSGTLGYWMGQCHAGHGYMKQAVCTVLPFVFTTLGLHRLEASCVPTNEASKTVLTSNGFQEEGYAKAYLKINGLWRDHILFALLQKHYEEKIKPRQPASYLQARSL